MAHKHWPKDSPNYAQAPVCPAGTRAACEAIVKAYWAEREEEYAQRAARRGLRPEKSAFGKRVQEIRDEMNREKM